MEVLYQLSYSSIREVEIYSILHGKRRLVISKFTIIKNGASGRI
jgi:hypothetical protein